MKCVQFTYFFYWFRTEWWFDKRFWIFQSYREIGEIYVFSPIMKIMIKIASLYLQAIFRIYIDTYFTLYFSLLLQAHFWFLLSFSSSFSLSTFSAALLVLTFYLKVPTESYLSQLSWQDSPLYTEMQPEKRLSQPEPPNPAPGQQPLQIMDLWEQYSDLSTGRSYYVNSITKERSWKPPRRARGYAANKVTHQLQKMFTFHFHFEGFFSPQTIECLGIKGKKFLTLACGHTERSP